MLIMKQLLFLFIMVFSLNSFGNESSQAVNSAIDAIGETETGKKIKKDISNYGKKALKKLPMGNKIGGLIGLALNPRIDYQIYRNNSIIIDYRTSQISYQFNYNF